MNFKHFLARIVRMNRQSMRECALNYRAAQRRGDLAFMVKWLVLARNFQRLNRGLTEAA